MPSACRTVDDLGQRVNSLKQIGSYDPRMKLPLSTAMAGSVIVPGIATTF